MLVDLFKAAAEVARTHMSPEDRERQNKEIQLIERDPFDFKFGAVERNSIERLAQYNHAQQITPRVPSVEELTPPGLL